MNRVSRIFTQNLPTDSHEITLEGDTAHYLLNVLRVKPGQALELVDGAGSMRGAKVLERGRRDLRLELHELETFDNRGPLRVTLELAVIKGERYEWALQKATELGVDVIQPVITQRSEVRLKGDRQTKKTERWRSIMVGALEQSKRSHLPTLNDPLELADLPKVDDNGIMLAPGHGRGWPNTVPGWLRVLIGPEGGFAEEEIETAIAKGYRTVGLGPRILRAETAAIAAMTLCQSHYGDFG